MSGSGARIADLLHKTATTGLIVLTIAGLADVTRGFTVLAKRNVERRQPPASDTTSSSSAQDDQ